MLTTNHMSVAAPQTENEFGSSDWGGILLISILWISMAVLVNPIGNFPLNDDWAYAASVKTMIDNGHFVFPDWSAANVFSQVIWGWLFGNVFGFSFTVLRLSTLTLGLVGVIAIYRLLREMRVSNGVSLFGAMTIAGNPIYFASSNTFMTEVPFFTFSSISLLYFTRVFRRNNSSDWILGTVAAVLALLVRQLGFAIPMAFAVAYLIGGRISFGRTIKAIFPLVVCIIAHLSFKTWLRLDGQAPTMYGNQIKQIEHTLSQPVWSIASHSLHNLLYAFFYICIFVLPILLIIVFSRRVVSNWRRTMLFFVVSASIWVSLHYMGFLKWPLLGNTLGKFGIGPMLQYGSEGYQPYLIQHLNIFWWLIGWLSIMSAGLMMFVFSKQWASLRFDIKAKKLSALQPIVFFALITIIYLMPVTGVDYLFDRYLLLPIATVLLFCLSFPRFQPTLAMSGLGVTLAISVIMIMGMVTVLVTHDYLSWNRTRWIALNNLVYEKRIAPSRIDGGFEFNGLYLYNPKQIKPNTFGWWVVDNEFLVTYSKGIFVQEKGYVVDGRYPVDSWLPYSPRYIYVMRRL